jgi:hypothetical protein
VTLEVAAAAAADLPELADVAAQTFPLACPPSVTHENIAAFIAENLTQEHFAGYLTDGDRLVLVARRDGRMIGYAVLIRGVPDDDDVNRASPPGRQWRSPRCTCCPTITVPAPPPR